MSESLATRIGREIKTVKTDVAGKEPAIAVLPVSKGGTGVNQLPAGMIKVVSLGSSPEAAISGVDYVIPGGNVATATKLATARTITVSGDISGSASFDGSDNVTISATVNANSVALGTDTTGNYAVGVTAGTGLTVSGTEAEGWSPTVAITNVGTAGTYTKVTTNEQGQVTDGTILVAGDIPALDASKITSGTIDPARLPGYVDDFVEADSFALLPVTGEAGKLYITKNNDSLYRWTGTVYKLLPKGNVDSVNGMTGIVSITDITGNSGTTTKLATARTINGTSFDGTANINVNTINSEIIKFDNGTVEGTDLYTFNGSAAKTINIAAGTGVTLTKAAGTVTINASNIGVTQALGTNNTSYATTAFVNAEITNDAVLKTGSVLTGALTAIRETKVVMGANDINLANGNLFTKTISGATTLTVSGVLVSPAANSFMLELTNGGVATVTWWAGVKWAGGTAPALTVAGVDILGFYSHDGGSTWRGVLLSKDSK